MKFINTLRFSILTLTLVAQAASAEIINVAGTSLTNDRMGDAVAAGDFNCDGYDDLVAAVSPERDSFLQIQFNVVYGGTGTDGRLSTPGNVQFTLWGGSIYDFR